MTNQEVANAVAASYGRCSLSNQFFDDFYDIFMNSSPEVAEKFVKTDMEMQKKLLKHGISFLIMYASGQPLGQSKMEKLGASHDRKHLNINPKLYKFWINSLLKTIKKHDPELTEELFEQWKKLLLKGIDYMVSQY